jgi:hypothetical protein
LPTRSQRSALWPVSTARRRPAGRLREAETLFVFADHDARRHLHLRHLRAQARKALRQFAADRAAAQHHQALGQAVELRRPHSVSLVR